MTNSARVLFIGLDSAEPTLLEEWADAGLLPNIRSVMAGGMSAEVAGTPGFSHGSHWPTLATSVNPGRHGRWNQVQVHSETRERVPFNGLTDFLHEPFWAELSRDGVRIAVIDVPRSPLAARADGLQIAEWCAHERLHALCARPAEARPHIMQKYGAGWERDGDASRLLHQTNRDYGALVTVLKENIQRKTRLCRDLLKGNECDFLMSIFGESHDIGHYAWHMHDPNHPSFDASRVAESGNPVLEIYMALDRALGEIAEAAPDARIVFFAGPGMEPRYTCNRIMPRLLMAAQRDMGGWIATLTGRVGRLGSRLQGNDRPSRKLKFWAVPNNENSGAIQINLVGRERHGIVTPGTEFDRCRNALREYFERLTNADSGECAVRHVHMVDRLCHGPAMPTFPDMLVEWNRSAPLNRVAADWLGELEVPQPKGDRTGDHTQNMSIVIAGGASGVLAGGMALEDIGPTVAGMFNLKLSDSDGEARPEMYVEPEATSVT